MKDLLTGIFYDTDGDGSGSGGGGNGESQGDERDGEPQGGSESETQGGSGEGDGDGDGSGDGDGDGGDDPNQKRLTNENKNLRQRLRDAEKERDDLKRGKMDEGERQKADLKTAQEEATTLRDENKGLKLENMILVEAGKQKIVDLEAVLALAKGKVEYDDDGEPSNVKKVLEDLAKERPWITTVKDEDTSHTDPARRGRERSDVDLEKLEPAQRARERMRRGYAGSATKQ